MQQDVIRLVGPGGAGKTTTGARLAQDLGVTFVDLDERFAATHGDISDYLDVHGYASYAMQNVQGYLEVIGAAVGPAVLALSSGFMTYATDVHPDYARVRGEVATSATTLVLFPSLDYETCVAETVRRQRGRRFRRSAEREEAVIRERFGVYRNLSAAKLETMNPISEVVDAAMAHLLPNIRLQPTAAARSCAAAAEAARSADTLKLREARIPLVGLRADMNRRAITTFCAISTALFLLIIGILHGIVNVLGLRRAIERGEIPARLGDSVVVNAAFSGAAMSVLGLFVLLLLPGIRAGSPQACRVATAIGIFIGIVGAASYLWVPTRPSVLIFLFFGALLAVPLVIWKRELVNP